MEKNPDLISLGARIKEVRLAKGMTQLELASALGKDHSSIARIESGRVNPSYLYLKELAKGLGVPLSTLLDYLPH